MSAHDATVPRPGRATGTWIVGGMIALAAALAVFAVWYQWGQTRRCLEFYGSAAAHRIQSAPRVELWRLEDGGAPVRPEADRRLDISRARGLVHLRRGLVEDANFAWDGSLPPVPPGSVMALAFFDREADAEAGTVLVLRLTGAAGRLELVGRPGGLRLGRIAKGLESWLADVAADWREPTVRP